MNTFLLLNGPHLNLLGTREPGVYGSVTLADVEAQFTVQARTHGFQAECFQSNHEGEIIEHIHHSKARAIVINAGALTHTSIGLRDALIGVKIPFYEVHLSNIAAREEFRHKSFLSDKAAGVLFGMGAIGYSLAIQAALMQK